MTHELKTHPEYFQAVEDGSKTFEVRNNDRGFKVDDILILKEYEPSEKAYTGKSLQCKVTYMLSNLEHVKFGKVIMGIKLISHLDDAGLYI